MPEHAENFKSQNRRFLGGLEPYDYLKFCKMYFLILKNVLFPYEIWFYISTYLDKSSRWESPVAEGGVSLGLRQAPVSTWLKVKAKCVNLAEGEARVRNSG